jgi:hypothetical protein
MLLLGALFALFIGGFWLYCLADVTLTPSDEFGQLPKAAWIAVVAGTFVIGAVAWLAVRRPAQPTGIRPGKGEPGRPVSQAGWAVGPDDDPGVLRSLNRADARPGTGDGQPRPA